MALVSIKNISQKQFQQGLFYSLIIFSIVFWLNKLNLIHLKTSVLSDNFISQIYGHSYLADLLILIFPFLLSQKLFPNKKFLRYSSIIFFLTTLIFTNSRSAIISLTIGLLFLKFKNKKPKIIKICLISTLLILFGLSFTQKYQNQFKKTVTGNRTEYWAIAIQGFKSSPLFGNGPNTFPLIRKELQDQSTNSNLAHSSILNFLCENGIIFTLIFIIAIFYGLKHTQKTNNVFFATGIIAIIHSLLDPTWSSPGIFIISLYLIFYHSPIFNKNPPKKCHSTTSIFIISSLCLLFFALDSLSNYFLIEKKYQTSLSFNPFNLDSRMGIISTTTTDSQAWNKNLDFTLKYFPKNEIVYQTLIKTLPFPENEKYYYQLFKLNPKENFNYYYQLTNIYYQNQNYNKLDQIFNLIDTNFTENQFLPEYAIPLSKISYKYALEKYSVNPQESLKYFEFTKKIFPILGYYQIEYANILWHLNQKQQAIEALNDCLLYVQPRQQCLTYLEKHQDQDFDQPGTPEFQNYIQNKLKLSPKEKSN